MQFYLKKATIRRCTCLRADIENQPPFIEFFSEVMRDFGWYRSQSLFFRIDGRLSITLIGRFPVNQHSNIILIYNYHATTGRTKSRLERVMNLRSHGLNNDELIASRSEMDSLQAMWTIHGRRFLESIVAILNKNLSPNGRQSNIPATTMERQSDRATKTPAVRLRSVAGNVTARLGRKLWPVAEAARNDLLTISVDFSICRAGPGHAVRSLLHRYERREQLLRFRNGVCGQIPQIVIVVYEAFSRVNRPLFGRQLAESSDEAVCFRGRKSVGTGTA